MAEKAEGRPLKHYEVSQYWSAKAHEYIAGAPRGVAAAHGPEVREFLEQLPI